MTHSRQEIHWREERFRLERFTELGMAVRRRTAEPGQNEPAKGTLFYIHGLGESGLCFERVICDPRLAAWTHVVPDMIGYGKSAWPEQPFSLERHAAGLDLLMDRLQLDSVTLVGHSMGGVIGLYLADRRRTRIEGFVNIEGNISPADCTGSGVAADQSLQEWLDGGFQAFLSDLYDPNDPEDPGSERNQVLQAYGASAHMSDPRTFHLNSCDLVRESAEETLAARLAELDLPQIYVYGAPRGTGERSQQLLTDVGIALSPLEPAGHWPYLDQHDAFVDVLVAFLNRQDGAGRQDGPGRQDGLN